jgi:hypothetical protein
MADNTSGVDRERSKAGLDRSTAEAKYIDAYKHPDGRTASAWYYKRAGAWLYEFEDSTGRWGTFESATEFRAFLDWEGWATQ